MKAICARCNRMKKMSLMEYVLCGKCKQVVTIMEAKRRKR